MAAKFEDAVSFVNSRAGEDMKISDVEKVTFAALTRLRNLLLTSLLLLFASPLSPSLFFISA